MTELRRLLEAAQDVARIAGGVALAHYREHLRGGDVGVEKKGDGSPVSRADRDAERAARERIAQRFPEDGILGEELGETRPGARRRWIIDPIDGTKSFLAGVPLWGTLVAILEGDEVLAGAAAFPATDAWIAAARGEGCFTDAGRARVSDVASLEGATVLTTDDRFPDAPSCVTPYRELASTVRIARSWGDAYGYFLVASGRAELMTDGRLSPWDIACFQPIVEEAGGVLTDWEGERTVFGRGAIATNAALSSTLRTHLGVPLLDSVSIRTSGSNR